MSNLFVIAMPFILRDVGDVLLLPFLQRVSLMVFHVFLMSDLYLSNVEAKNCCLAVDMLLLKILLKVLRLMLNISYSLEPGLVNLIFLYKLSLNLIDRNSPLVIHFDFLCLYLLNFTSLLVVLQQSDEPCVGVYPMFF